MFRGTTPKLTFTLSIAPSRFLKLYITGEQNGRTIFEKSLENMEKNEALKTVSFRLTQDETLDLVEKSTLYIQGRGVLSDGNAVASDILQAGVGRILKDGVI